MLQHQYDAERQAQISAGARMASRDGEHRETLSLRNKPQRSSHRRPGAKPKSEGHEALLKSFIASGAEVTVEKLDGTIVQGPIKHADKYTVSIYAPIRSGKLVNRVIFKHDISEFYTETSRPTEDKEEGIE